jgi:hypothetical protein
MEKREERCSGLRSGLLAFLEAEGIARLTLMLLVRLCGCR